MLQQRTQIYLEPSQHAALLKEARRLGLSLAAVVRKLVDEHFRAERATPSAAERRKSALALIGLGESKLTDVSENTDEHLGEAIYQELVRDRPPVRKKRSRKGKS